jgi:hypothetical protein
MYFHPLPHRHHPVNYWLLGMSAGVILIPTGVLALLFLIARLA